MLARISLDELQFNRVLNALVQLFLEDRPLLETRGAMVIRKLCSLLDSSSIYMMLAKILNSKTDLEFTSLMVQTLNLILLTAPELSSLRKSLKNSFQVQASEQDRQTFSSLFFCWSHNPVATFSLCLLAQCYDLSSKLILKFAEVDVTVGFLMQIDKLIQLLESPIFIQLRLHLLETYSPGHADLLKSLYGLLMLLPQSQAYKTLSDRLTTVSSLHMHIGLSLNAGNANGNAGKQIENGQLAIREVANESTKAALYATLISHFETIQEKHTEFRLSLLRQKSLLPNNSQLVTLPGSQGFSTQNASLSSSSAALSGGSS